MFHVNNALVPDMVQHAAAANMAGQGIGTG